MKAIILAGGFGMRIRPVIGDEIPKCMAPINGKPVIEYIIEEMRSQGITDITLSVYYRADVIINYFGDSVKYKVDDMPFGTGGAIKNSISGKKPVLVVNGDTLVKIDYNDMLKNHIRPITIAVTKNQKSAGVCIVNPDIFKKINKKCFSFELDVVSKNPFSFYPVSSFIDIGTPEGYAKAKSTFS